MSIDRVQGQTSLVGGLELGAAEVGGDSDARLAMMLLSYANESRDASGKAQLAEEERLRTFEAKQVAELRSKAEHIRDAAVIDGLGQIVEGGAGLLASGMSMVSARIPDPKPGEALKAGEAGVKAAPDALRAGGKAANGGLHVGSALVKERGDQDEADATAAAHRAQAAERRLKEIEENAADARDLARTAVDFMRDLSDAEADAQRAALFSRV